MPLVASVASPATSVVVGVSTTGSLPLSTVDAISGTGSSTPLAASWVVAASMLSANSVSVLSIASLAASDTVLVV